MIVIPSMYGILGGGAGVTAIASRRPFAPLRNPILTPQLARRQMPGGAQVSLSLFNSATEATDVPVDLVTGARGTKSGTVLSTAAEAAVSPIGVVSKFASGSSTYKTMPFDLSQLGATVSVAWWMYWDAFGNGNEIAWEYTANANTQTNSAFNCNPDNGTATKLTITVASNSATNIDSGGVTRPSGAVWHHYATTINRAAASASQIANIWIDGTTQSITHTASGNLAAAWVASSSFYFFSRGAASNFASGRIAHWNLFNGTLTDSDVKQLYTQPWYLLRRRNDWS